MSTSDDTCDPRHPHEPEILPILDSEGRCLVCVALVKAHEDGFDAGLAATRREPLWLLTGDLDWLEFAISDYVWRWGQHLPGVSPDTTAGVPVAVANMAMTVIRKNVRRIDMPPTLLDIAPPSDPETVGHKDGNRADSEASTDG